MGMATAAGRQQQIDVGKVVSRAFEVIKRNAGPYAGVALLLGGLPGFLVGYATVSGLDAANPIAMFTSPLYWGAILFSWLCGSVLQAALVRSSILDLGGRPADVGGSLSAALALLLPLVGLTLLTSIILMVGFILLIVPGIIFYVIFSVAVPVLVEERPGVIGSLERSVALTRGSRWQVFGVLAIFVLFYMAVSMVLGVLGGVAGSQSMVAQLFVSTVTGVAVSLVLAALLASLYVELRTVKEGATTDSLAAIFE
jgi:uncharacterized membrane protein